MHLLQVGEPSQHYRQFERKIQNESIMRKSFFIDDDDDGDYLESSQGNPLKMRIDIEKDVDYSQANYQRIGSKYAYTPPKRIINPDHIRKRVELWRQKDSYFHGCEDEKLMTNSNTSPLLHKRMMVKSKKENNSCKSDEFFYPHLSNQLKTENVRKDQFYQPNFLSNFGECTFDHNPIQAPTKLNNGRINSTNRKERKPFRPVKRPKTSLSTSSSAKIFPFFSESEKNNKINQNTCFSTISSSSSLSSPNSFSTSSSFSTRTEEFNQQPLKCNLFGNLGSKRADHALYVEDEVENINHLKSESPQRHSIISISSLLSPSTPRNRIPILTNLYSVAAADRTSESEANTSGSAMAEHGHENEPQREEGEIDDPSSRERRSGSIGQSGGGGGGGDRGSGGDDRQSSASTGFGKAGDDSDGRRYHLRIVQQPEKGCAFGNDVLSRLAIGPPLIVQIRVTDLQNNEIDFTDEITRLICQVSLLTQEGENADMITLQPNQNPKRMLYGTLTATATQLLDIKQRLRTFFIFPEISIRSKGKFRLNIDLFKLSLPGPSVRQGTEVQESVPVSGTGEESRETSRSIASPPPPPPPPPTTLGSLTTTSSHATNLPLVSIISEPIYVVLPFEYQAPHITDLTRHFAANGVGLLLSYEQAQEN